MNDNRFDDLFALAPTLIKHLINDTIIPAAPIIRPVQADDADLIWEMHQRLSLDTIYKRYHSPRVPTRQEIAQICTLDEAKGRAVIAIISGQKPQIVGIAYYIVSGQESAEAAFLVEDSYQGQGIGKQLMQQLRRLALAQGIRFFDAYVQPSNERMIHLFHHTGQVIHDGLGYGVREMRVHLTNASN